MWLDSFIRKMAPLLKGKDGRDGKDGKDGRDGRDGLKVKGDIHVLINPWLIRMMGIGLTELEGLLCTCAP